jgi:hypothetical protein
MKRLNTLLTVMLTLLVRCEPAYPASSQLDNGVRVNNDTTGTNTTAAAVTITARTNLNAGAVRATNNVAVGVAGSQGLITLNATGGLAQATLAVDTIGFLNTTNSNGRSTAFPFAFGNVAEMVALAVPAAGQVFSCLGYTYPGDGGGGQFVTTNIVTDPNIGTRFVSAQNASYSFNRVLNGQTPTPQMFGGFPDDGVDDSAAIQAAIDVSETIVYFPPGVYTLESQITIPDKRIVMTGAGIYNTELQWSGPAGASMFYIGQAGGTLVGFQVRGMTLDGASVTPLVILERTFLGLFEQVRFEHSPGHLNATNSYEFTVSDCIFSTAASTNSYGFTASGGSGHRIFGNLFETEGGIGLRLDSASNGLNIFANVWQHNHAAIVLTNTDLVAITIQGNFFEGNTNQIVLGGSNANPRAITIAGNEFAGVNEPVYLTEGEFVSFTGNDVGCAITFGPDMLGLFLTANNFRGGYTNLASNIRDFNDQTTIAKIGVSSNANTFTVNATGVGINGTAVAGSVDITGVPGLSPIRALQDGGVAGTFVTTNTSHIVEAFRNVGGTLYGSYWSADNAGPYLESSGGAATFRFFVHDPDPVMLMISNRIALGVVNTPQTTLDIFGENGITPLRAQGTNGVAATFSVTNWPIILEAYRNIGGTSYGGYQAADNLGPYYSTVGAHRLRFFNNGVETITVQPTVIDANVALRQPLATASRIAVYDSGSVLTNGAISEANILTEAEAALTYQPLDADLTELAALTSTNVAVRTASGWISTNHLWLSDITANNGIVFEVNAGSTTYQLGDGDFITLNANATLGTQNDPWDEMWGNQLWVTSDDELQTFFIGHASGPAIFQITASQPVLMEASTITLDGASSVLLQGNNVNAGQFDGNNTAGNTRFLLYDVDNGTLERVSVGIADSGGVGYKVLRIPN